MLDNDIMLGEDESSTTDKAGDIELDLGTDTTKTEETDTKKEETKEEESTVDINDLIADAESTIANETEEKVETDTDKETDAKTETTSDNILGDLLSELDSSKKEAAKLETDGVDSVQVGALNDSLKKMEDQLKKLTNEKTDLTLRNAELETFGSDSTDPKILILSKHLDKAKGGDDRSKEKVSTIIKEMLYELTGEDYDKSTIDSKIDTLSASESYNTKTNPNLNIAEKQEEFGISI